MIDSKKGNIDKRNEFYSDNHRGQSSHPMGCDYICLGPISEKYILMFVSLYSLVQRQLVHSLFVADNFKVISFSMLMNIIIGLHK